MKRPETAAAGGGTHRGFTLIELLVVIAIIALLVSILLPSLNKAKGLAKQAVCISNMRQWGQATFIYMQDHGGAFPLFHDRYGDGWHVWTFWYNTVGPYMGMPEVPAGIPDDDPRNTANYVSPIRRCPAHREEPGFSVRIGAHYGEFNKYGAGPYGPFVHGAEGATWYPAITQDDVDEPATWIMYLDTAAFYIYTPSRWRFTSDRDGDGILDTGGDPDFNGGKPRIHTDGCNVVLCDGHAEWVGFDKLWENDGGDVKHDFWWD